MDRNGWPKSIGISGRIESEMVADLERNTHTGASGFEEPAEQTDNRRSQVSETLAAKDRQGADKGIWPAYPEKYKILSRGVVYAGQKIGEPLIMPNKEPEILQQGKKFHASVQEDWRKHAEGRLLFEFTTDLDHGKKGRMDILVRENQSYVAVGEIKNSDWDKMSDVAVKRNAKRQIKQIWGYIHSQLRLAHDVTPGVIFPCKPTKQERMELIEALFEADGISVVWNDETTEDRKRRSGN